MKKKKSLLFAMSMLCLVGLISCGSKVDDGGGENKPPVDDPVVDDKPTSDIVAAPTYQEDSVSIHYYRKDRNFKNWALWLWDYPSGEGKEFAFNGVDEFGAVAAYPLSTWEENMTDKGLGFIVKSKGDWSKKDVDGDRIIEFTKFEKDENKIFNVYLKSGDKNIYSNDKFEVTEDVEDCKFDSFKSIYFKTNSQISSYIIYENDKKIIEKTVDSEKLEFNISLDANVTFENSYEMEVFFKKSGKSIKTDISMSSLFKDEEFTTNYTYDGDDLGAIYTKNNTTFKVWSPISKNIKLRIYNNGTPKKVDEVKGDDGYKEYQLNKEDKGIWSFKIDEDLASKYYTYVVTNSSYEEEEIVDPYAKSCGISGLRGQIVDFSKTNPDNWENTEALQIDRKSLVAYETHVSDLTSSATWTGSKENVNKFAGAYEENTTYTANGVTVSTGFDNIKELGVNAVQLQPIYDQANDETTMKFNWGYNPLNYNCLEGSYSSNPYDGYTRIKEFKSLVQAYNKAGINIIMDVVYNHVSGAKGSNFDVLMPGYYFRYYNGNFSNGSGCGNETASEMPMFRKFMIDSAKFYASEYKLGGFRFDLMGLHDLSTMDKLTEECKKINSSICIYGEPWSGGTSTLQDSLSAKQINGNLYQGYGQFNDKMRDALIKGGLSSVESLGWIDKKDKRTSIFDMQKIEAGIKGITLLDNGSINDPDKTTNYVTCHDNYTLTDRFIASGAFKKDSPELKSMNQLANSVVFTSQGTSFMLAGEEFLRTKNGDSNSYDSGYDVNTLDYELKIKNIDLYNNYKKLIDFKKNFSGLHLGADKNTQIEYHQSSDNNEFHYFLKDQTSNKQYIVIHTNGYSSETLPTIDLNGYELFYNSDPGTLELSSKTSLKSYQTIIAYK